MLCYDVTITSPTPLRHSLWEVINRAKFDICRLFTFGGVKALVRTYRQNCALRCKLTKLKSDSEVIWLFDEHATKDSLVLNDNRLLINLDVLKCIYTAIRLKCIGNQRSPLNDAAL